MGSIYTLKEIPFLLTLLFGILGYQINRISDNIINSPSIEYSLEVITEDIQDSIIKKEYVCFITNITSNVAFRDLDINFLSNDKNSFQMFDPAIEPLPPSSQHFEPPRSLDSSILVFHISSLQPGDKYRLTFTTKTNQRDAESKPYLFLTADNNTVQIIEESLTTWFVKNSRLINILLIILWFTLIVLYFLVISKNKKNESTNNI